MQLCPVFADPVTFVKHSASIKRTILIPIEVLNLFSILLMIFRWKQVVLCNKITVSDIRVVLIWRVLTLPTEGRLPCRLVLYE